MRKNHRPTTQLSGDKVLYETDGTYSLMFTYEYDAWGNILNW